jgi:hypothetical protein
MAGKPLISVLVPTKDRAAVLGPCLATLTRIDDPDLEIIVSNNASTDGTAELLDRIGDPRLVVVAPDAAVAMTDNFELAMSHARGDYVVAIGDDDGLLATGWRALRQVVEAERPAVVNWQPLQYGWPSDPANPVDGTLVIKAAHLRSGHRRVPTAPIFEAFVAGRIRRYRQGANIYHGCVSRSAIEAVRGRIGRYFFANAPDVGATIANLKVVGDIVQLGSPVSIGGSSRYSTGGSMKRFANRQGMASVHQWISQAPTSADALMLPREVRSVHAITLDSLVQVMDRFGDDKRRIDIAAWHGKIADELARVPEPWRSEGHVLVGIWLEAHGFDRGPFTAASVSAGSNIAADQGLPEAEATARRVVAIRHELWPRRLRLASRPGFCENVETTAEVCEAVIGEASPGLPVFLRMAGAWRRAFALVRAARRRPVLAPARAS